jgi:uncharacterized protein (TIGR03437 family)
LKRLYPILTLIPVLLAAGALNAQTVTVDKSSLSFAALVGGSPVSQALNVSSSGNNLQFSTFVNVSWLSVSPTSGTTPQALTVTADPTGLSPFTYNNGKLTVFDSLGHSAVVNVTLTVSTIGASPAAVNFAYQSGGTIPTSAAISLTGQAITFTAAAATTSGGNWLQVSPASGTTPGTVSAIVNSAVVGPGMSPGTYNGSVTITPTSGATTTPIVVPVTLTVSAAPPVTVNPASVSLVYQVGGANNPGPQTVTLSSTGTQPVSYGFAATADPNPSGRVWVTVNPSGGSIPADGSTTATVGYDSTANLPAGTYNGDVTLFTPGGVPQSQDIPVKLLVSITPLLSVPNATLAFNYQVGGPAPAGQSVTATSTAVASNSTTGQMQLTITSSTNNTGNWLSVPTKNPVTGTPFTITVNPAGLAPGTYSGTVTVRGTGAGNGPQTIPVTFKVSNDPQLVAVVNGCNTLVQQSGCPVLFADQIGQVAPFPQTLQLTSSNSVALNYTVTTSTTSCGNSWLAIAGTTTGSTDASLTISVNPGAITAGTKCDGSVVIDATNPATGAAAPNSPLTIPVSLYVSSTPLLTVTPSALSFTAQVSGSAPAAQNITLNSTSLTQPLNYSVTYTAANNWLFVGPGSGTTQAGSNVLTVSVLPLLLSAGTYSGTVTITATEVGGGAVADSPITIPVVFTLTAGNLTVSQTSLSFSQTFSGPAPKSQTVNVTSSGQPLSYAVTSSTGGTGNWLTVSPASGSTSGSFQASVDGSNLQPGTYNGSVTVTSTTPYAGNSPIVIPVTLVVNPGTISVAPASLTFTQVQGGPPPASTDLTVSGTPGSLAFTVTVATDNNSGSWLTASPTSGNTPAAAHITANAGSLPIGQYTGTVTVAATGSTQSVKVTLNVVAPQTLTVSPASLNFAYTLGLQTPLSQTVQLSASGGIAPFTASASTKDGGKWLTVSPASGSTPTTLTVAVSPGGLAAGNYTGTVTVNSTSAIAQPLVTVNFTITQVPKPVIGGVQNAASFLTGGFSPGENIVIYGTGIGPADLMKGQLASGGVLATNVGNTRVLFDGVAAPIIYVSAGQSSVMVPYGVSGRTQTSLVVEYAGVQSDALSYNVVQVSPAIYTLNLAGTGPGAILNQDYSVNGAANPAAKGSIVQVYMTGEGITQPPSTDGGIAPLNGTGLNTPVKTVTATVNGIPATVEYDGSAPGIVYGVMQVNVMIPANAPSGPAVPIQVSVGSVASQTNVTLAVK